MLELGVVVSQNSDEGSAAKRPKLEWLPTKAEPHVSGWRAHRNGGVTSRLVADLQIRAYENALKAHARGALLDLGCGNAPFAGIYAPLVETYTWADWGKSHHQIFELDQVVDLNKSPLPFLDNAFDTILLSDVLEHVAEPDGLAAELRRILAPGGRLIVGVPFLYFIHEQPHDHFRYTRYQLEYLARKHGLNVIELSEIGGPIDVWTDISCKLLGAVWQPLAGAPYFLGKMLRVLRPFRQLNERGASKMPLAYIGVFERNL